MPEISGYAFPNDIHVHWSLMIVMYPYLTGFVAGSFIVTSLYHLFGKKEFEPIARLALGASFSFLMVAFLPLLLHLGQPFRALNVLITPNFTSAMAGFGRPAISPARTSRCAPAPWPSRLLLSHSQPAAAPMNRTSPHLRGRVARRACPRLRRSTRRR
jgi:hypothetical protein